jgi:Spy/CpxP family protein refolding chaperone
MKSRFLRILCIYTCLVTVTGLGAFAQSKGPGGAPGGPPPGGYGPGGHGGPSNPSAPNNSGEHPAQVSRSGGTSTATSGVLQLGPVGRWWDDKSVTQTIGLRNEQKKQMDAIFNANKPTILASYKAFLSEQSKLEKISKDPTVDQARVFAAIDAVSQARASLQKATTQMLLQIRQKMDSGQLEKLEKLK